MITWSQQHAPQVTRRQRRRQRAVNERAADHDVDVVEPVAQDRDPGRHRDPEDRQEQEGVPAESRQRSRPPRP